MARVKVTKGYIRRNGTYVRPHAVSKSHRKLLNVRKGVSRQLGILAERDAHIPTLTRK